MILTKIPIFDTELYYTEFGSGLPLFTMHGGLGIDHKYLRTVLDSFQDIFNLIYYDFRGHGLSDKSSIDSITFEQLADDNEELRKKLKYKKIGVLGHSAGGYIALKYAIKYPNNLQFLILIDTAPANDYMDEIMANIQKRNPSPEVINALNTTPSNIQECKDMMKTLNSLYFNNITPDLEKMAYKTIDNMIFNPEIMAINDNLMASYNVVSQLSKIKVPTLIMVGKEDFICPPSQAQRMHEKIPNSDLIIFENSGHYIFYEEPEKFNKIIRDWVKKLSP